MKIKKDSLHDGRDKAYVDLDRMTNEGLAGGTVTDRYDQPQIEDAQQLKEEERPREV